MDFNEFIQVGSTKRPHGLKGELKISFEHPLNSAFLKTLFLNEGGKLLPYFIEQVKVLEPTYFIIKFEDVDDRSKAENLSNKKVFIAQNEAASILSKGQISFEQLIGFKLKDESGKLLGTIEDIFELPKQVLAQIFINKKEILIPLNDENMLNIDEKAKIVSVKIPEGLIELYL